MQRDVAKLDSHLATLKSCAAEHHSYVQYVRTIQ
jgi:hypothetical protein